MIEVVNDDINIGIVIVVDSGAVAVIAGEPRHDVVGLSDREPVSSLLLSDNATATEEGLASLALAPDRVGVFIGIEVIDVVTGSSPDPSPVPDPVTGASPVTGLAPGIDTDLVSGTETDMSFKAFRTCLILASTTSASFLEKWVDQDKG